MTVCDIVYPTWYDEYQLLPEKALFTFDLLWLILVGHAHEIWACVGLNNNM